MRTGSTWSQQAALPAPPQANGHIFGAAVAVSGDTALVSACCRLRTPPPAVFVYGRSGSTWTLQATLAPPGGAPTDLFGDALGLSGHTAVVGGGPTYVYVGSGSTWTEQAELIPTDRSPNNLGMAVAIQANTVVAGAGEAAYVFVRTAG